MLVLPLSLSSLKSLVRCVVAIVGSLPSLVRCHRSFVGSLPSFLRWFVAIVPSLVRCHRSFVGSFLRSFVPSLRSVSSFGPSRTDPWLHSPTEPFVQAFSLIALSSVPGIDCSCVKQAQPSVVVTSDCVITFMKRVVIGNCVGCVVAGA